MKALRLAMCVAFGLGTAAMSGCDDKDKKPADQAKPATPAAGATGDKTMDGAMKQAQDVTKGAGAAVDAGKTGAGDAAKNATDAGGAMMASGAAAAPGMLAKLQDAINANKLDEAKTYLDKLTAMRAQLPEALQKQLDALQGLYTTAKAKAGAAPASGNK